MDISDTDFRLVEKAHTSVKSSNRSLKCRIISEIAEIQSTYILTIQGEKMVTLEELLEKGEKVLKGEKKKPKESEIRERYNLDALIKIANRTLKSGEAYKYPHKEFAELIGFDPIGKIQRPASGGTVDDAFNISLPADLRAYIESGPIEGFDDTVRIRMNREGKVIVEPYKEFQKRLKQRKERSRKK